MKPVDKEKDRDLLAPVVLLITEEDLLLDLLSVLHDIDSDKVELFFSEHSVEEIYCGNCEFITSNGWRITVFIDCLEWDYIDMAVSPNPYMPVIGYKSISEFPQLESYSPKNKDIWTNAKKWTI